MGQSGLGSRTFMEQSGTQPTAPSRQVHWYLQLLWKVSPLLYTVPPNTQVAPSRAARGEEGQDSALKGHGGLSGRSSPVQTPIRLLMRAPKSQ